MGILLASLAAILGAGAAAQAAPAGSPVARHGKLRIEGGGLVDEAGKSIILRGMSSMGLQWKGRFVNEKAFTALAKDWKVDLVRLAMYVGEGGYATYPAVKNTVTKGIDLALSLGLYVIIDWHVLNPGDPNDPVYAGAADFFKDIASKYGSYPNVIYEIANEPNGPIDWELDIKPYAERIVAEIRAIDPDNLIVIGTGRWSQDVDEAAASPVAGKNLAYALHFYAGTHGDSLKAKVDIALGLGAAIFCTEWGTSLANGDGGPFLSESRRWIDFLETRGISWANWALFDGNASSAAFKAGAPFQPDGIGSEGGPAWKESRLSASGAFVRGLLREKAAGALGGAGAAGAAD